MTNPLYIKNQNDILLQVNFEINEEHLEKCHIYSNEEAMYEEAANEKEAYMSDVFSNHITLLKTNKGTLAHFPNRKEHYLTENQAGNIEEFISGMEL